MKSKKGIMVLLFILIFFSVFIICEVSFAVDANNTVSQDSVVKTSVSLNNYITKNHKLPTKVSCDGNSLTIMEYTYLMGQTIQYKVENKNATIAIKKGVKYPNLPSGDDINSKISKNSYYSYSKWVVSYINKSNKVPNYIVSTNGKKNKHKPISSYLQKF
ncbi:hypothetical protein [Methanobrevibacter curvatus]|uniref:Pseudomurein-binding repeat protein n=1 Tax=Methanobrevibacter curvatus TaxID=49547 RepID=A0A165YXS0_9EURY|nr:hypothetical protein [Methanobrevibacter curvatus]KZX09996.1 pseudomurein-binding repeat protein [Methanobrevibacter curvatus]